MNAKIVLWIGVGVLLTIFTFQNAATVEVRLLFWTLSMSRVLLIGGAVIVGFLGGLTVGWEIWKKKRVPAAEENV